MKKNKRITIEDIARLSGVSRGTISRVLNNSDLVHEETRKKVQDCIRKMNYHPSPVAKALATGRTNFIGLVITDITNPFYAVLSKGVIDAATRQDFNIVIASSDGDESKEQSILESFVQQKMAGVILAPINVGKQSDKYKELLASLPVIFLSRINLQEADTVEGDDKEGVRLIAEHFAELKKKSVSFLGPSSIRSDVRKRNFIRYAEGLGMTYQPLQGLVMESNIDSAADAFREYVEKNQESALPEAIFAFNDLIAIGVSRVLAEQGLSKRVAVVGYDNIEITKYVNPPVASVDGHKYEIGFLAMELLAKRLRKQVEGPQNLVVKPKLVLR